jgi:predicted transcriptional regulator
MPKLTVRFGNQMSRMLKELAEEKGTTQTEIIRRALATYKYLNDEVKDGDKSVSVTSKRDKAITEIILP